MTMNPTAALIFAGAALLVAVWIYALQNMDIAHLGREVADLQTQLAALSAPPEPEPDPEPDTDVLHIPAVRTDTAEVGEVWDKGWERVGRTWLEDEIAFIRARTAERRAQLGEIDVSSGGTGL